MRSEPVSTSIVAGCRSIVAGAARWPSTSRSGTSATFSTEHAGGAEAPGPPVQPASSQGIGRSSNHVGLIMIRVCRVPRRHASLHALCGTGAAPVRCSAVATAEDRHRMPENDGLHHGPLGPNCLHVCVDMQRLFAEDTDWHTPWMERVLPVVRRIAEAHAPRTIFTRFIPAERPGEGSGTWKRYYERWASMTIAALGRERVALMPVLDALVPPAEVVDKRVYSPWVEGVLEERLRARGADTLIVTGGETDVCVLATVLGAVDRGYRVVVLTDALCSSSDETHDALMQLYHNRYGQQVETVKSDALLAEWTA